MALKDTDIPATSTALARHQTLAEVLQGNRPMTWSDWVLLFDESQRLTPSGLRVAHWAVSVLEQRLGSDFLQRATAASRAHPIFFSASGLVRTMFPGSTQTCFNWLPKSIS